MELDPVQMELLQAVRDGVVEEIDTLLDQAAANGMQQPIDQFQRYADLRDRLAEIDKVMAS